MRWVSGRFGESEIKTNVLVLLEDIPGFWPSLTSSLENLYVFLCDVNFSCSGIVVFVAN